MFSDLGEDRDVARLNVVLEAFDIFGEIIGGDLVVLNDAAHDEFVDTEGDRLLLVLSLPHEAVHLFDDDFLEELIEVLFFTPGLNVEENERLGYHYLLVLLGLSSDALEFSLTCLSSLLLLNSGLPYLIVLVVRTEEIHLIVIVLLRLLLLFRLFFLCFLLGGIFLGSTSPGSANVGLEVAYEAVPGKDVRELSYGGSFIKLVKGFRINV